MITKEQAYKIVVEYLEKNNIDYSSLPANDKIGFNEKDEVPYGKKEGEIADVYFMSYGTAWGNEERAVIIYVDAKTSEILYAMNSHGYLDL